MSNYKDQITKILKEVTEFENPQIDFTSSESFGDYSTNVAMVLAKEKGKNPRQLAEELVTQIKSDLFEKVEVAGPGFINFWLKKDILVDNLIQIEEEKENYGKNDIGKGKTVVIDYSSPNIAKPFGIGHLRSTVIGQALYNLYEILGYNTIGDNHLGDWGTQFGKLLYMIDSTKTKDFSIENLEKLYVEFHKLAENDPKLEEEARSWFKRLEDGDEYARTIWKQCVNVSLNEFNRIYDLLQVKIDNAYGESFYEETMKEMVQDKNIRKHLIAMEKPSKGWVVDLNKKGIKTPLMFLKSDGATTYATRDLATLKFRSQKWDPDIIIYEVGAEQTLHFKQVFEAAKLLGIIKPDVILVHTAHGLYLAPDGKKFSTRKGKTIKLEEVLNEAVDRAKKLGNSDEKTAKEVGIGAIKYFDLMHGVQSDVVFDWEKIMNMEGNSGPYLQYTYARIQSVISKAGIKDVKLSNTKDIQLGDEENSLLRKLSQFSEIIESAAKSYSPNILANFLYDLASKFNTFYNKHKIVGGENEEFKLLLTKSTGQVIKNGLNLLGIETPQRM